MATKNLESVHKSVSGGSIPFVTSSVWTGGAPASIKFIPQGGTAEHYCNFVFIKNTGTTTLRFGFDAAGVTSGGRWYPVAPGAEANAPIVAAELIISGTQSPVSASIFAGIVPDFTIQSFDPDWKKFSR